MQIQWIAKRVRHREVNTLTDYVIKFEHVSHLKADNRK